MWLLERAVAPLEQAVARLKLAITSLERAVDRRELAEIAGAGCGRALEAFDPSLKHLSEHEPVDFKAVAVTLPSRGRAIDGGHQAQVGGVGVEKIAHTEFQRRHQSPSELAVDVAEARGGVRAPGRPPRPLRDQK